MVISRETARTAQRKTQLLETAPLREQKEIKKARVAQREAGKEKAEKERARAVREKARGSEKEERTTVTEWTLVTSATEIGRKKAGREIGVPAESNGCHLEQLGRLKDNGAARNGPRV